MLGIIIPDLDDVYREADAASIPIPVWQFSVLVALVYCFFPLHCTIPDSKIPKMNTNPSPLVRFDSCLCSIQKMPIEVGWKRRIV